jgi:PAN domain
MAEAIVISVLAVSPVGVLANPMSADLNFVDFPGGDYFHFDAGHQSICATSCATDSQCSSYTYVISTGVCWKKNTIPSRKNDNCCISGVKLMGDEEVNFDRPGSNIKPGFPTAFHNQCEDFCKADLKCRAYTWVKPRIQADSGMCWLKNKRPSKVANSCCISGVRLRDPVRNLGPTDRLGI